MKAIDERGLKLEREGFRLVRRTFTTVGRELEEEWRHPSGEKVTRTGKVPESYWDDSRRVIDTAADPDYEVPATTAAKDSVYGLVYDVYSYYDINDEHPLWSDSFDEIALADKIVEKLITLGWRPTEKHELKVTWDE